jgi:two-component system NtrC family response regulator
MADERPTLLMVEDDLGLQKQMRWSFDRYNVLFADSKDHNLRFKQNPVKFHFRLVG